MPDMPTAQPPASTPRLRIVYPLEAVRPSPKRPPTPLSRDDRIPDRLHRSQCAPGPSDPAAKREYLGSPQWTRGFMRYLAGASVPWWRHPYVVARLARHDPQALRLVTLANEVAQATGAPLIEVVPQVAPRLGLRARRAWMLYLRTERFVQQVYHLRTAQAA